MPGLDSTFLHYGIRRSDMEIIEQACRDAEIDPEWVRENILKPYNEQRSKDENIDDKSVKKIVKRSLRNLPKS